MAIVAGSFLRVTTACYLVGEGGHSRKPNILPMALSLSSIVNVRSCSGGLGINCDRLFRAMAQSWTSLKQPHVECRCINFVRRWRTSRSCSQKSTGLKKIVALPRG